MKLNFTCFLLALLISTVFVHVDSKKTKKSKSASKDRRTKSHSHTHSHSRSHEGTPGSKLYTIELRSLELYNLFIYSRLRINTKCKYDNIWQ